jgi:hypothetical protein
MDHEASVLARNRSVALFGCPLNMLHHYLHALRHTCSLRPLEKYVGLSIFNVGILFFVFFFSCVLKFSSEFVCFLFVERGISTVIWILEFYYFV